MEEDQAWVRETVERFMSDESRESAFDRFRTANWKAIIEWQEHLQAIKDRNHGVIPAMWEGVNTSVTAAIQRERQALKYADELEASGWKR
jgi:hypothetical protein